MIYTVANDIQIGTTETALWNFDAASSPHPLSMGGTYRLAATLYAQPTGTPATSMTVTIGGPHDAGLAFRIDNARMNVGRFSQNGGLNGSFTEASQVDSWVSTVPVANFIKVEVIAFFDFNLAANNSHDGILSIKATRTGGTAHKLLRGSTLDIDFANLT